MSDSSDSATIDIAFDALGYVGGISLAICTVPQLWQMYKTKSAGDISTYFLLFYIFGLGLTIAYLVYNHALPAWIPAVIEIMLSISTLLYKMWLDRHAHLQSTRPACPEEAASRFEQSSSKDSASSTYPSANKVSPLPLKPSAKDAFRDQAYPDTIQNTPVQEIGLDANGIPRIDITLPPKPFRGFHVLLDYCGFEPMESVALSAWMMDTMQTALARHGVRCVHSHAEVFEEGNLLSPPGFAQVCLLDESHASAHCYSDRGMLAVDVFTCGGRPDLTRAVALDIHAGIMEHLRNPTFRGSTSFRFPTSASYPSPSTPQPLQLQAAAPSHSSGSETTMISAF